MQGWQPLPLLLANNLLDDWPWIRNWWELVLTIQRSTPLTINIQTKFSIAASKDNK